LFVCQLAVASGPARRLARSEAMLATCTAAGGIISTTARRSRSSVASTMKAP